MGTPVEISPRVFGSVCDGQEIGSVKRGGLRGYSFGCAGLVLRALWLQLGGEGHVDRWYPCHFPVHLVCVRSPRQVKLACLATTEIE